MDIKRLAEIRRFKSTPTLLGQSATDTPLSIDAENGIIRNIIMAQVGPAKGHGVHLEQSFIEALITYDQKNFAKTGVKARFDHPALCDGTMGTQLGTFSNFRVEGDKAVADLQLLEAADSSPKHPKMREWTLKMAQEKPDFIMSSIVFSAAGTYQYDAETGEPVQLWKSVNGERVFENEYNEANGNIFIEMGDHFYTDLVEAGAATDALFSEQFNGDKFGVQVVSFLEDNSDILTHLQSNPAKVTEFLEKLNIKLPFDTDDDANDTLLKKVQDTEAAFNALVEEHNNFKLTAAEEKTALTQKIKDLQAEVAELREESAGEFAAGETVSPLPPPVNDFEELTSLGSALRSRLNNHR